ncbi:MAG: bifunctional folylpolyglutamate synthase/dihydrofolate synthase [Acidobacteria bacterium]|nr:bifunctional folylpolyglutamate synthase/dihydrofolate synthase [Acidobacteriota bacterium]
MNFDEALAYLLSLGHEMLAMKLGLANVERLLSALGDPQKNFPSVQIAGTNGKGSTAAMLARMCRAAGIKTGLYTSPHLISVSERIRVNGVEISSEDFARAATGVRATAEGVESATGALPTFFEQVTAIALAHFREAGIELAILETGLGGRLDATTAARAGVVAITPVAFDHQEYLGHTLAEIAAEKAAVIRPGVRAVVAPQAPEAAAVIAERCRECGVQPRYASAVVKVVGLCDEGRLRVRLSTSADVYGEVCLALRGRHQFVNAAVAVELAETLRAEGFAIARAHIVEGLERAEHAGRLELDTSQTPPLLFDGAHNAAGARALRDYLDEFVSAPVTLVFGAMREKALEEIGAILFTASRHLILTRPDNPRAAPVDELVRAVPVPPGSSTITVAPSAADAMTIARTQTPPEGIICVTGSLYLVGEVKSLLINSR